MNLSEVPIFLKYASDVEELHLEENKITNFCLENNKKL
jgi:hypothetical protein